MYVQSVLRNLGQCLVFEAIWQRNILSSHWKVCCAVLFFFSGFDTLYTITYNTIVEVESINHVSYIQTKKFRLYRKMTSYLYNLYIFGIPKMASQQLQIRGGTHIFISLLLHQDICFGYSLESPQCSWRNKKNTSTFWLKKDALSAAMASCHHIWWLPWRGGVLWLSTAPLIICLGRLHITCRHIFNLCQLRQGVDSLTQWLEHWIFIRTDQVPIPRNAGFFFSAMLHSFVTPFHVVRSEVIWSYVNENNWHWTGTTTTTLLGCHIYPRLDMPCTTQAPFACLQAEEC